MGSGGMEKTRDDSESKASRPGRISPRKSGRTWSAHAGPRIGPIMGKGPAAVKPIPGRARGIRDKEEWIVASHERVMTG